jgi:hypothetical protein
MTNDKPASFEPSTSRTRSQSYSASFDHQPSSRTVATPSFSPHRKTRPQTSKSQVVFRFSRPSTQVPSPHPSHPALLTESTTPQRRKHCRQCGPTCRNSFLHTRDLELETLGRAGADHWSWIWYLGAHGRAVHCSACAAACCQVAFIQ